MKFQAKEGGGMIANLHFEKVALSAVWAVDGKRARAAVGRHVRRQCRTVQPREEVKVEVPVAYTECRRDGDVGKETGRGLQRPWGEGPERQKKINLKTWKWIKACLL